MLRTKNLVKKHEHMEVPDDPDQEVTLRGKSRRTRRSKSPSPIYEERAQKIEEQIVRPRYSSENKTENASCPSNHKVLTHIGQPEHHAKQVSTPSFLQLMGTDELTVKRNALKVIANLAAEERNQDKIILAGGLDFLLGVLRGSKGDSGQSVAVAAGVCANLLANEKFRKRLVEQGVLDTLLELLGNPQDEQTLRAACTGIANFGSNETNQLLLVQKGVIPLLVKTTKQSRDVRTLWTAAGAIANLCGNAELQLNLVEGGGIKALLEMLESTEHDIVEQVARGIANFAKTESKKALQGNEVGRSLLLEEGALPWVLAKLMDDSLWIRQHFEIILCHLARNEANANYLIKGGALWELIRISKRCSRSEVRTFAQNTLLSCPTFSLELKRLHLV